MEEELIALEEPGAQNGENVNGINNGDLIAMDEAATEPQQKGVKRMREEEVVEDFVDLSQEVVEESATNDQEAPLEFDATAAALPSNAKRPRIAAGDEVYEEAARTLLVRAPLCENVLDLPPELMLKIFVYLGFIDLSNCSMVCHQWKAISSDDVLWKRMYYELWGTNAKTWKQLFASHYPEHEELDMQELIKLTTRLMGSGLRHGIMGLYRLDKSYDSKDHLRYSALYRNVWDLTSAELKAIVANEVTLTSGGNQLFDELKFKMQHHGGNYPQGWKELTSYDRAQTIFWEMLRYESNSEALTWMSEDEANSCTEWLFGYFPYRRMSDRQLAVVKSRAAFEEQAEAEEEEEQAEVDDEEAEEDQDAGGRMIGAGVIVGVGEVVKTYQAEEIDLIEEEDDEEAEPRVEGMPATEEVVLVEEAEPDAGAAERKQATSSSSTKAKRKTRSTSVPESVTTNTTATATSASGEAIGADEAAVVTNASEVPAVEPRGRSQVARFFHTGAIRLTYDNTFVYGFAAISSSRFCTYWIEAEDLEAVPDGAAV